MDKLLQNNVAKRIVITHVVKAIADECHVEDIDLEKLAEESISDPKAFENDIRHIISIAKNCLSR